MSRYAEGTTVSAEKSRVEAERVLQKYGADGFGYGWDRREVRVCSGCKRGAGALDRCEVEHSHALKTETHELVLITFKIESRTVRLDVPMPTKTEAGGTNEKLERRTRERWRALVLVLKAKLEAVECGISTLESEFLANVVMADGRTIGQAILPRLSEAVSSGRLLPGRGET